MPEASLFVVFVCHRFCAHCMLVTCVSRVCLAVLHIRGLQPSPHL